MARTGDLIENPHRGERGIFRLTTSETNGELLRIESWLIPRGLGPVDHVHPGLEERFEVLEGRLRFRINKKVTEAGKGDVVVVPPGTRHGFSNPTDTEARFLVELRPAGNSEAMFELGSELVQKVKVGKSGLPINPLLMAFFGREFREEIALAGIPLWLQRALSATFAPIADLLRYRERYPIPSSSARASNNLPK